MDVVFLYLSYEYYFAIPLGFTSTSYQALQLFASRYNSPSFVGHFIPFAELNLSIDLAVLFGWRISAMTLWNIYLIVHIEVKNASPTIIGSGDCYSVSSFRFFASSLWVALSFQELAVEIVRVCSAWIMYFFSLDMNLCRMLHQSLYMTFISSLL